MPKKQFRRICKSLKMHGVIVWMVYDMTILNVVDTASINGDTTVVVNGDDSVLKNGIGVLDANGKPYIVKSIGLTSRTGGKTTIPLLIEGSFSSDKIFV